MRRLALLVVKPSRTANGLTLMRTRGGTRVHSRLRRLLIAGEVALHRPNPGALLRTFVPATA